MINLKQKGEWSVYFFDIDHILIYSATIELIPKKYTRNPNIVPGKKNKLVIELGVNPKYYFKKTGLKCLMKRTESLEIFNLEDEYKGNAFNPVICDKNWKRINSLEISLRTILDIIKKKNTYLVVGDLEIVMNILNSSESLRFL